MSLLDWNSIENSRHGITVPYRGLSKTIPLPLNSFGWNLFEDGLTQTFFISFLWKLGS